MKIIRWCIVLILLLGGSLWLIGEGSVERDQNEISNKNMESIQEEISIEKETIKEDPIEIYMEGMSLEEKIGQLFIAALNGEMGNEILLKQYQVGGIVLFKKDIQGKQQLQELIDSLQKASKIPLWIAIDEEGGRVSRIGHISEITKEPFKAAYEIGQTEDTHKAYEEAKKMGKILYDLGINMDFAPVADIYNNESNTVIGNRSFGHTKEEVTPMVIAFAKGLKEEGIFPVIKHFPGHGNTYQDSHEQIAYIDKTLQDLEEEELVPFFDATRNGVEGMMVGHLVVSEVDQLPATLSPKWGSYIKEHFDTEELLLITDAMNMGAVVQTKEGGNVAVESFLSGMDMILMPDDLGAAKEAMKKAYEEGKITKDRLDESVRKILLKKVEQNLLVLE